MHHHEPWPSMAPAKRELRNRLRAHGRQLGDRRDERRGDQAIDHLITECAYEHWHRMLFARYLAETDLLIEPRSGVSISLAECEELARTEVRDWLDLAAEYAQRMLPQIFRSGDPVLEVALPPETRSSLEDLMTALPREIFIAADSLGWVYQYWQTDRKEEVNRSEKKIGSEELPAVTQLFTEDYMVHFLLHNTLGAWWAGKVLAADPSLAQSAACETELRSACAIGDVEWTYLRFVRDEGAFWRPSAGTFQGWPRTAKEITLLDPCMGSGHFLVFALPMLVAMRAKEEHLPQEEAVEAVLRDNIFGLEIDPRCTQIAAFNVALAAWRHVGCRQLPPLHLACSGLSLGVTKVDWLKLAERSAQESPVPPRRDLFGTEENLFSDAMKRGFERLYDLFVRGPWLGSLIDPRSAGGDLVELGFDDLEPILTKTMERPDTAEISEMAVAAQGLTKAARVLASHFTLIVTNVPYLGRGKQDEVLKDYCEQHHPRAKADLATCFIERCMAFCADFGTAAVVGPQNWLFLPAYKTVRRHLLETAQFDAVVRLGANAFQNMNFWAATTAMSITTKSLPAVQHTFLGLDASPLKEQEKKAQILTGEIAERQSIVLQSGQLRNPDARITLEPPSEYALLQEIASAPQGLKTGDDAHFRRCVWELSATNQRWRFLYGAPDRTRFVDGASYLIDWGDGDNNFARLQGQTAWNREGFILKLMGGVTAARYFGELFDSNVTALVPNDELDIPAIWEFVCSADFVKDLRAIEQSVKVNNATVGKVPCDLAHWREVGSKAHPTGLPLPETTDPTQWTFDGCPETSETPLHVAVARLLGFRWPRQSGYSFPHCPAIGADGLDTLASRDGIVPLNPVKGQQPAASQLLILLGSAFGEKWTASRLDYLLSQVGFTGKSLDDWLRDGFFEQHCALFHQRPFVWHIWDGRRDGFHTLVNYHRLAAPNGEGRRTLEKILYSYLGDWIDRQRTEQKAGVEGADARVAAAEQLKSGLASILAGEAPYDIFTRWKPLSEQPIGWEPDVNDGVRINIRPFMRTTPSGSHGKGACILRVTPKIKWEKDRGKEPQRPREDFPWFWGWDEQSLDFEGTRTFDGNRWNDLHYTRAFKQSARGRRKTP